MSRRRQTRPTAEDVRAAIAGWHLRIQTDVKRTSSLPTSMFDACDPMLEAALADSAAHIFRRLMAYGPPADYEDAREEELRCESVSPQEIAALCLEVDRLPETPPPDLQEGCDLEYLWILLDLCLEERGPVRERARRLLHAALGRDVDIARVGRELAGRLRQMAAEPGAAPALAEQIRRLGADLEQHLAELAGQEERPDDRQEDRQP